MTKNVYRSLHKVPVIRITYKCNDVSRWIFEKYSTIKFHENPLRGSRVVPDGQT